LKFYFPFLPSYCCGVRVAEGGEGKDPEVGGMDPLVRDGVVIENVHKFFGDFESVRGVSLNLRLGEETALLGVSLLYWAASTLLAMNVESSNTKSFKIYSTIALANRL
jgi:hypothetical protein